MAVGSGEAVADGEGDATIRASDADAVAEGDVPALAVQAAADNVRATSARESLEPLCRADPEYADIASPTPANRRDDHGRASSRRHDAH